jgi:hypothetical protein
VLRASALAEREGVPSASLLCEGFVGQAVATAAGLGMPNLPGVVVPGHVDAQTPEELRENVLLGIDSLVRSLTVDPEAARAATEPGAEEIVFRGGFDEVNRHFYDERWSDGLPIVPPTLERVQAFLRFTDRDPHAEIGVLLPDRRRATVWNVAVNGVMAGCRPEYMPVLVALADAMADPAYGVEHSGNTPGSDTLIVLDGPLVGELGFNYEQGALRDGFQANTSIGRFWRLYLRNVAGFLPHGTDKGTFGNTWRVVLAENMGVLEKIGWPSIAADQGVPEGSAVTISRYTGGGVIVSVFGTRPEQIIPYLADALTKQTGWELIFTVGMATGTSKPLLVLSPIIAETLAKAGISKRELQERLYAQARLPASKFERYIGGWTNLVPGHPTLLELVAEGKAPPIFAESDDPDRFVPIVCEPQDIMIAVSGDPLRTNAYSFVQNGMLGAPTTKRVELPRGWGPGAAGGT